tara:strand:+ start:244 stop:666 length:423 start_codon:yes stop_codon:yes gene_type:complete
MPTNSYLDDIFPLPPFDFNDTSDHEPYENVHQFGGWSDKIHGKIIYKHTEETKKRLSEAHKGMHHTNKTREKMSKSHTGSTQSPETIEKRAIKLRGQKRTAEVRKKMSISSTGIKQSPETIAKRIATRKRNKELRISLAS